MSVEAHRKSAPRSVACFVLTVSDTRTAETDASGNVIAAKLTAAGHAVVGREIVRDVASEVAAVLQREIGGAARAIITTGGTGIAARDTTFEAVSALIERPIPGFGELFRHLSYEQIGSAAMLSRACAGITNNRVIFVLPGSQNAVTLAMDTLILPELGHIVSELTKDIADPEDRIGNWLDRQ